MNVKKQEMYFGVMRLGGGGLEAYDTRYVVWTKNATEHTVYGWSESVWTHVKFGKSTWELATGIVLLTNLGVTCGLQKKFSLALHTAT